MAASSRGLRVAGSVFARQPTICASCRITQPLLQSRRYSATAAAADAATTAEGHRLKPHEENPTSPVTASRKSEYRIRSGVILTRAPLITRPLTDFENAFFFYQKRLNERLVLPFRHTLFFKKDTSSDIDWRIKFNERGKVAAKELGRYFGQSRNAWNDELLVGSSLSSEERIRQILLKDAENRVTEDGEEAKLEDVIPMEQPMARETEADKKGDVKRLDRKLDQTLYLLVQNADGKWQFPAGDVPTDEDLYKAASRVLESSAGVNMNTWLVGRVPVAHMVTQPVFEKDSTMKERGEKVFFLKGRIMAGQADLKDNKMGYKDLNWLTKDEIKEKVGEKYFKAVRNMMADR